MEGIDKKESVLEKKDVEERLLGDRCEGNRFKADFYVLEFGEICWRKRY